MLGFVNPENPEKGVLYILVANLLASLVKPILLFDSFRLKASYDSVLMKKNGTFLFTIGYCPVLPESLMKC